jgi:competence protein ComEC
VTAQSGASPPQPAHHVDHRHPGGDHWTPAVGEPGPGSAGDVGDVGDVDSGVDGVPTPGGVLGPERVRSVGDAGVVVAALAAVLGAWWAADVPLPAAGAAVAVALLVRRAAPIALACLLVVALLGYRAEAGLANGEQGLMSGRVQVVTDPERVGGSVRLDVRWHGKRYEAWARGSPAGILDEVLVGDSVDLAGRLDPAGPGDRSWFRPRHVVGRLVVDRAGAIHPAAGLQGVANRLRRLVEDGASHLSVRDRALVTGLVLGDDRGQLPEVKSDFRRSGLTHLLAVSGQNIALLLALAGPILRRSGGVGRLALVAALLAVFVVATRAEPSVLRAATMAAIAGVGAAFGRPAAGIRHLSLAVIVLLAVDPLLVWSTGFQLSVAASAGILLLSPPLSARLWGPRPLRDAIAVTASAQVATAPLLLATFGTVPLASLLANLLAGPAAGAAMTWALPAGLVAGLTPGWPAHLLHVPSEALVGWIAWVAQSCAAVPLPQLGLGGVVVATGVGVLVLGRPRLGLAALAALAALVALARPVPSAADRTLSPHAELLGGPQVVLVVDRPSPAPLLGQLASAGVGRVDALVVRSPSAAAAEAVRVVRSRHDVRLVLVPAGAKVQPDHRVDVVETPVELTVGHHHLVIVPAGGRLDVTRTAVPP